MNMEARLEHVFQENAWRVWLYERRPQGGITVFHPHFDYNENPPRVVWEAVVVEPDELRADYSLTLPDDMLKALVGAGNAEAGLTRPDRAQAKHLADAIEVRDRLLVLVEGSHEGGRIP
jgi:hypothetical protein